MKGPRIIIVHSPEPEISSNGFGAGTPAHAFGPFESEEDAIAFEVEGDDDCYKFVMVLVGPDPGDRDRAIEADRQAEALSGWVN